ncbi:hypothetical protein QF034_008179 [Streptomyces africanus]|uniref:Uncharacterized protein n=1 Tax=Streptomyces africanus TaxID=231024 RepID=A0ABU0R2Q8_9ACTN|nr:SAVMC3_10250 family protein [Streptomyces africanus]MDQ0753948.1 hypothetical protein [Streptomyces africanus]
MRDLLYLSENKMRVLSPQVPRQLWKKAGFEAGVNVGIASVKTTLPNDVPQSSVAMLDPVIEMIEQQRTVKGATHEGVRVGDWVQFQDKFFYGDAAPGGTGREIEEVTATDVVYFAAQRRVRETPFVLIGSSANVVDRWQSPDSHVKVVGTYYMEAVRAYAARLARLPDEGAESELTAPRSSDHNLAQALNYLTPISRSVEPHSGWAAGPVTLRGHARVLAAPGDDTWGRAVLATPLYIEYTPDHE